MATASPPARRRCEVIDRQALGDHHGCLQLAVSPAFRAVAGQFVQILCRDADGSPGVGPYLRRPFSLGGLRTENGRSIIDIIYRVVGLGSAWLDARRAGDEVDLVGPLGHGFSVGRTCTEAFLVAGGVGHAPLLMLARQLARANVERMAFCGARRAELLPFTSGRWPRPAGIEPTTGIREWAESSTPVILSTDDGSVGFGGTVVQAMEAHVAAHPVDHAALSVYACGPPGMLQAVAARAAQWKVPCQLALETLMACGMGTCQSCVLRVGDAGAPQGWRYKLCCTDGPVFGAEEIIW